MAGIEAEQESRGLGPEGRWEIDPGIRKLDTGKDIELKTARDGARQKVMSAERSDPFTRIWRAGGIDKEQFLSAQRLVRDEMQAAGVGGTADTLRLTPIGGGAGGEVTRVMIDASCRVAKVLQLVGIRDRLLLSALLAPALRGVHPAWRDVVTHITGVTERHRQGQVIEDVLENLRLAYVEVDREEARNRAERARAANDVRPVAAVNEP